MRRVGLGVPIGLVALLGCGSFRDVFTSHSETAARVGSRELKSAQVAAIITRLAGPNPNPEAAEAITGVWVDLQLFADRVAAGKLESDSVLLERLMWPQIAQQKVAAWHDTVVARRAEFPANAVDSAYAGNEVRVFQHILVRPSGTTAADTARAKAEAERIASQSRSGDFGRLAARYSADEANKNDGGFLPASPRGSFVPEFESAGWALEPGEVSGVVPTQFGYHVIRRPPLGEVRDRMLPVLRQRYLFSEDSVYMAEITERAELEVKSGAAEVMRNATTDLGAARKSGKVLVGYKDGSFKVKDLALWLGALPPQSLNQMRAAPDSVLQNFAKNLAQNMILLRQADSAGIRVSPEGYAGLLTQYRSQIADLKQVSGLDAAELSDTAKTPLSERKRIAVEKIDGYFDKLSTNQAQFRPVPPTLSAELRATGDFKIYQAGVARVLELVQEQRRKDSAAAPAQPGPGLQPAPGGPPTPGQRP